ncbi:hypothetical protein [Paenibacillus tarimensis]|uniref:hypothetical protein n=1 Tax=Paenibacillus tarimensis TaxID=416012 RepID=UPI001F39B212|nr:hypothetical protein [Paenibacillus tarimensis]MCF2945312.1 hypothetical protein [Paenibacillus tarimensis]
MRTLIRKITKGEFNGTLSLLSAANLYLIAAGCAMLYDSLNNNAGAPNGMTMAFLVGPFLFMVATPVIYHYLDFARNRKRPVLLILFITQLIIFTGFALYLYSALK